MLRTKQEIKTEIAALKALKPAAPNKAKTQSKISLAIDELQHGVDQTAGEWEELSDSDQFVVTDAFDWKNGLSENKPSESFEGLIEK